MEPLNIGTILPLQLESEMRSSYMDYAMSVIVSRALPDVRDGLKPGQRRILHNMNEQGMTAGARYQKCAAIVGDVLKLYHPHGDAAVYDTLVRMAQDFSLRYPLVDGQGNFGSIDGDAAAAYRYTEARMSGIAAELVVDIEKDTVDWVDNYAATSQEPTVLPARIPNLLINGSTGIAVGMTTNIPPHNLTEVCEGEAHLIDHPDATTEDLMKIIRGPDFPTGGIIIGREAIAAAYGTGHGRLIVRARVSFEEAQSGRERIIVHEIPYMVNKATLVGRIAELVSERKLEGIADLNDESDRHGMRIVIELKKDARPLTVLNNLYKHTALQTTFVSAGQLNAAVPASLLGAPAVASIAVRNSQAAISGPAMVSVINGPLRIARCHRRSLRVSSGSTGILSLQGYLSLRPQTFSCVSIGSAKLRHAPRRGRSIGRASTSRRSRF